MKHKELLALAKEAGKSIKSEADLTALRQMLTKVTVEAALNAELDDHDRQQNPGSVCPRPVHTRNRQGVA